MISFDSNWEIIQLLLGIVLMVSFYYLIFHVAVKRQKLAKLKGDDLKYYDIRSIRSKILKGEIPDKNKLIQYAENVKFRSLLFELLNDQNKIELFPKVYQTQEKLAESYLATWLDMNEAFDQFPNEIKASKTVQIKNGMTAICLQFKVNHPYEWSEKGWMNGYVFYHSTSLKPVLVSTDFNNENLFDSELIDFLESISNN